MVCDMYTQEDDEDGPLSDNKTDKKSNVNTLYELTHLHIHTLTLPPPLVSVFNTIFEKF